MRHLLLIGFASMALFSCAKDHKMLNDCYKCEAYDNATNALVNSYQKCNFTEEQAKNFEIQNTDSENYCVCYKKID